MAHVAPTLEATPRACVALWTEPDPAHRRRLVETSPHPLAQTVGETYRFEGHAAMSAQAQRLLPPPPAKGPAHLLLPARAASA